MLKLPSWLIRSVSRIPGAGMVMRAMAAAACGLATVNTAAQTPPPPSIQLTASAYSVNENNGTIRVALRRFGNLNTSSTVQVSALGAGGSNGAIDGQDFIARSSSLTFGTNATEIFFDVILLDNARTNESKFINLSLSNATGATLGVPNAATIEITDDESGIAGFSTGYFEFSTAKYAVTDYEGTTRAENAGSYNGAYITVVRKGGSRGRVQVDVSTGTGSAWPTTNYTAITNLTLTFDDYEMSKSFIVPIIQYEQFEDDLFGNLCLFIDENGAITNFCGTNGPSGSRIWPFSPVYVKSLAADCYNLAFLEGLTFTNLFTRFISATFEVPLILSNPRLDPGENSTLPRPTLGAQSTAGLGIIFVDALKTPDGTTIPQFTGHAFERAHYRAAEGGGGSPTGRGINFYQMWVTRDYCPDEPLVRFEVNNVDNGSSSGDHLLRTFQLDAGSDYATPFVDYIPPGTAEWNVAMGRDPSQVEDGIIRWAINERGPKSLTIPILSDDRVEFDEDLLVQLYYRPGDTEFIAPPGGFGYGYNGYPRRATLTIAFDNFRFINEDIFHVSYDTNGVFGAEQPAGAADRRYNRHGANDIDPPFNPTPGANASVLAVAIGQDGKLYLGGEFEAINTKKLPWVFHFGRMTRDGQVDTNFVIGTGPNRAVTAIELQPDGKAILGGLFSSYNSQLRNGLARVNVDGSLDSAFNPGLGANAPVRAVKLLPDGKVLIGGEFTQFNGTNVNYFARLLSNGALDTTFNVNGSGPDGFVYAIAVSGEPVIIDLKSLDVDQRRERADTYDTGSNAGTITLDYDFGGFADDIKIYYNGVVVADTLQVTGQGTLTVPYGPGPVDSTLVTVAVNEGDPGLPDTIGTWSYHLTINPNADASPIIGGLFGKYNGVTRNRIARVLPNGNLDTSFDPGTGIENGVIYALAKHGNKPVFGGAFNEVNRVSRNNIAQLNPSGSVDTFFDPGTGFNDIVYSLILQPTGKPLCGGLFTEFNTSRRVAMARLNHDGKLDTSFMDTAYNQFAGLPNDYTWKPENSVNAMVNLRLTNTYTATITVTNNDSSVTNFPRVFTRIEDQLFIGGSFTNIGGGLARNSKIPRNNFARVWGGSTPGPGSAGFISDQYTGDESSGRVFIVASRDNGHLGAITTDVNTSDLPQGAGAATEGIDYSPTARAVLWPSARVTDNFPRQLTESYRGPNSFEYFVTDVEPGHGLPGTNSPAPGFLSPLFVFINNDSVAEGDEQIDLNLKVEPTFSLLGGEPIPTWPALGRSKARLSIIDDDFNPGVIGFGTVDPNGNGAVGTLEFFSDENVRNARITLIRTNGSAGRVSVNVRTKVPSTLAATPGEDYVPFNTPLTVVFAPGQTNAFFDVTVIDDTKAELDELIGLALSNPTGGAAISAGNATLTIVDDDFAAGRVQFTSADLQVDEGAGVATVTIRRSGGSTGRTQVQLSTADLSAKAGLDYVGVTNLVLTWESGDTANKIVTVPILDRNAIEATNLTFQVVLSNPTVGGAPEPNALGNQKQITVEILNNDAFGNLHFSQPEFVVDENGTNAIISVIRANGVAGDLTVNYQAVAESALPGQDFTPVSGTLTFTNNQTSASFVIPIIDDSLVDGTKTVRLSLANQVNTQNGVSSVGTLGFPSTNVVLSIIDNELENIPAGSLDVTFLAEGADDFIYALALQPKDGRLLVGGDFTSINSVRRDRLARLFPDGTVDPTFFASASPDGSVRSLAVQEDGRILIAGGFNNVGAISRHYIARLVPDGGIDLTFDPGASANNPIFAMIFTANNKILIGGDFSAYGPTFINGLAQLNLDGSLDTTFKVGTGAAGTGRFTVFAIAQQLDGKILVGGDFESFNNVPARRLVRLNTDGSVDRSFNTSLGADASVRSIVVQPDGQILVGGMFTTMQGTSANHIARLNRDGTIDASFNTTTTIPSDKRGADGPVLAIAVQIDGKIMLGGDFNLYNGVTRRGITRLNPDGTNDPTINFGTGVNGSVAALMVQPDRKVILAGGFTEYNGEPRLRIARINGGSIAGNGRFEFVNSTYIANEAGTNVVITVRRTGGTSGSIVMNYRTEADPSADNPATAGTDYAPTSGTLVFAEGETQASFKVQITNDSLVENEETFAVALNDPPGQPVRLGDQPTALVIIVSDDSEIFFTAPAYSVGESIPSASAPITISRVGSISVPATVEFRTSNGSATAGADYIGQTNTILFAVGESERTVAVGILPDQLVEGNESLTLNLANPSPGATIRGGGGSAQLTIVDDDFAPGEIRFERATYSVREGNTIAQVAVIRTNGLSGTVTVQYATTAGSATPGNDYTDKSGILTFNDGVGLKFIEIKISDDDEVENNETINIQLSNVSGGAALGLDAATLTIIDDDLGAGSVDTSFNPGTGANGPVRAIEYDGRNHLLIAGDFTAFNNDATRNRIARLQLTGAIDSSFSTNNRPNGAINSLALQDDGRLLIGGAFNTVNSAFENRIARLLAEGALDTSFSLPAGLNAAVTTIAIQPGDKKVLIGGMFTAADFASYPHIARLNPNGTVDTSFDPGTGADKNVNAVALQTDGKILVGGEFGSFNRIGAGRIVRLNQDGSVDTSFRTGTGFSRADGRAPVVHDILVLSSGRILVVGDFTSYNGTPRAGIAMLDQNGTLQSFASGLQSVNGAIRAVAIQHTDRNSDEKVLIGGDFTAVDGTPRGRVARLDSTGRFDPSFDPGDGGNDSVLGIFVQPWDGRVVVVGAFTEFNNNPNLRGIARMNNDKAFLPAPAEIRLGTTTLSATGLQISFAGELGVTYVIEGTNDFITWTADRVVTGAGDNTTVQIPTTDNYRFFRVRRQ